MTLFEAAKSVPALDVAERYANVRTVRKGSRAWAYCTLHKDARRMLFFDLDGKFSGRYKCKDCNRTGERGEAYMCGLWH